MNRQSDQRQHDDQYGQRPAEMGMGTQTGTGMDQQPRFGESTRQYGAGGRQTGMGGSPGSHNQGDRSMTDRQGRSMQSGQQTRGQETGQMSGQRNVTLETSQPALQGMGMQGGSEGMQPHSFDDHMTDELWIALEDFSELSHVAAWCATRCATGPPELGRCARVCQDLAEIAALNEMLIARDSMFGPEMANSFMRVADEGLQTLRQFEQRHPHVLETAATIERTMNSCEALLRQVGGGSRTGGRGTGTRMHRPPELQGTGEQGQYGRGTSGQPTGRSERTDRQY